MKPLDTQNPESLELIRALYDESSGTVDKLLASSDAQVRAELEFLASTKRALESRPAKSPPPAVLDSIFARAQEESNAAQTTTAVEKPRGLRLVTLYRLAAAAVVIIAATFAFNALKSGPETSAIIASEEVAPAPAPALQPGIASEDSPDLSRRSLSTVMAAQPIDSVGMMLFTAGSTGWDYSDDLQSVHFRLEALRAGTSGTGWGEPVPLESMNFDGTATQTRAARQLQAGSNR